jgi:hypothetical protein
MSKIISVALFLFSLIWLAGAGMAKGPHDLAFELVLWSPTLLMWAGSVWLWISSNRRAEKRLANLIAAASNRGAPNV